MSSPFGRVPNEYHRVVKLCCSYAPLLRVHRDRNIGPSGYGDFLGVHFQAQAIR